ncbi:hypothetical protein T03_12495 [Trichinella britovi]|uniref:Uncharacterized protein n=1 Tax=Trichinella britovi TaxID=45882 RepID=A0A0V1CZ21_TRIBR|nr:hypothetical protein T03_12495 [Trichinella britovi]
MESATTVKALCVKMKTVETSDDMNTVAGVPAEQPSFEDSLHLDGNMYTVRLPWLTDGLNS